ncbi:putative paraflagellar rod component par4 [Leptomonas pyrrhocoris]|uniref:Putative paraflagellar rod component par4 n=1 Tax=Leptomonas pyrrhocoris TaxID=157538 RepID=A0A0N0DVS2_LEPPY|nr:putative paraflagellar rod component par4 [Leptomonas pyrrhocoris]XP_015659181.1 putative paraflagellar rod component par4 [Leptomonas pyrrhocoris]KPA80741.1 putative paraflagellar rod component par4 [Leptomonas pyrrhocoris]KPA80742.1 putative paraflagellar rod component par4 [Leptomonas pyrrhocoris]|eukprot:XP_015659180.1 putative paraflagellar rod component par4 [Leptomonas pyrrhocoris]
MPAKKGKGKKEAAGKSSAETARLTQLRAQEAEAERFLRNENERRQRDELEERITFLRDEQVRALREKDNRLGELTQHLKRVTAAKEEEQAAYELQIKQLSNAQEVFLSENSLSKVEMDELRVLVQKERTSTAMQLEQLRETLEAERCASNDDRQRLRAQACEALAQAEVLRQRLQRMSEENDFQERSFNLQRREMEKDLEKALATGKALREALDERDADGRKNVALLELLNAQLEADTRRHETEMVAEQESTRRAKEDADRLASACTAAHEALDKVRRGAQEAKQSADAELHELKQLMEQVRFDAEYLRRELDTLNAEHREAAEKAEKKAQALQAELQQTQVELEAATKENEEVKSLLLRKEREHFDKVTFLNAQVSNGRTTTAQLREEVQRLRDHHEKDRQHYESSNQKATQRLESHIAAEKDRNQVKHSYDEAVLAETDALKRKVSGLHAQLASQKEEFEQLRTSKDDEIARLRGILDVHFIPNRKDAEVARESVRSDAVFLLKEELCILEEKMQQREKVREETEAMLRSRVADQADVIAALQLDLKQAQLGGNESMRALEKEIVRLQKTLEMHQIA